LPRRFFFPFLEVRAVFTTTDVYDNDVILSMIATAGVPGVLATAKVGLIEGTPQLTKKSAMAAITQPVFPGYALKAETTWSVLFDGNDRLVVQGSALTFQPTDGTAPVVVNGWFLTNTAGDTLFGWEFFPSPVSLRSQFDLLGIVPQVAMNTPPNGVGQFFG
jgi:hypothetical protein